MQKLSTISGSSEKPSPEPQTKGSPIDSSYTLKEKIGLQKKKLKEKDAKKRGDGPQKVTKVAKKVNPPKTARGNYHKDKIEKELKKTHNKVPPLNISKSKPQPKKKPISNQIPFQVSDEPRFDGDNYLKSGTAFNISEGLSQSQLKGPISLENPLKDASFTERIVEDNSICKMAKRKNLPVPLRAMSTDERKALECTFSPMPSKTSAKYSNVKSKISCHLDELKVFKKPLPPQNIFAQNRSFQGSFIGDKLRLTPALATPRAENGK